MKKSENINGAFQFTSDNYKWLCYHLNKESKERQLSEYESKLASNYYQALIFALNKLNAKNGKVNQKKLYDLINKIFSDLFECLNEKEKRKASELNLKRYKENALMKSTKYFEQLGLHF